MAENIAGAVRESEPDKVFTIPEEKMAEIHALQQKMASQDAVRMPHMEQVQVKRDNTPVMKYGAPEIITSSQGPMIVRKRKTTTILYHEDGTSSRIPIDGQSRYLNKGWSSKPMADPPKFTKICPYCFKKFRPSTEREMAMNSDRRVLDDPEVQRLLAEMKETYAGVEESINDVEYKLAEHIRVRHGKIAAFTNDPIYRKLRQSRESV